MARIRTIKPEFPQSESMGNVSRDARLCFILLWTISDDSGRLRGNSKMLASLLFPYDADAKKHIDAWLTELSKEGCISRYESKGNNYLQIVNWSSHQKIDKPTPSKIPSLPADSLTSSNPRESSLAFANPLECSSLDQGRDQEGIKECIKECIKEGIDCAEPPSDSTPSGHWVIGIPLVDKTEFFIYSDQVDEWRDSFPAVDVVQKLREMRQWCIANPAKKKTRRGVVAFIVRWLTKEQDSGRGSIKIKPQNSMSIDEQADEVNRILGFFDKPNDVEVLNG